ncbi:hypothetical protein E2562_030198 [Oryza meyeriana var. granulata]|uniref:Uncharacterized protein n=1 Tax=Oryza meyeriana var. granulata TaxID=110450 RepID=A0A6G1D907_9ORYZ|nr:hypothetical protein E2562_030198 [Oryza meyeriana var. granulata]
MAASKIQGLTGAESDHEMRMRWVEVGEWREIKAGFQLPRALRGDDRMQQHEDEYGAMDDARGRVYRAAFEGVMVM